MLLCMYIQIYFFFFFPKEKVETSESSFVGVCKRAYSKRCIIIVRLFTHTSQFIASLLPDLELMNGPK